MNNKRDIEDLYDKDYWLVVDQVSSYDNDYEEFSIFMKYDKELCGYSLFGVEYFDIYLNRKEAREDTIQMKKRIKYVG